MNITLKTVKKMLLDEYDDHYKSAVDKMKSTSDAQIEMVHSGYRMGHSAIVQASNWEELENALTYCGYRMSLQEWVDSY